MGSSTRTSAMSRIRAPLEVRPVNGRSGFKPGEFGLQRHDAGAAATAR
jgi:hypothetical protein